MSKNKLKTHKGTKKVVKSNGKIGHPGTRHNTGKKNAASNRSGRKASYISKGDAKRLRDVQY